MAKRRAHGEGNIRKRADGRWEGRYTADHDENGKRITKNVLGKTQAEVREKLKAAIAESEQLDMLHVNDHTVATWLRLWYDLYAKPNIRTSTARNYLHHIELHTIPYIGNIKLKDLTTRDLQKLYNDLRTKGRVRENQKGKNPGLSASTVRGVHLTLHNALDRAVKEKLILRNPSEDCIVPKPERIEMNILQPKHVPAYLKAAEARGVLPLLYLALTSGIRKGELAALLWNDLDVTENIIFVSKQAVRDEKGEIVITKPKTDNSTRPISLPQETVDMLIAEHKKHPDCPYMFTADGANMYHPDSIVNLHKKVLKDAELPHIRFHDLRHTFATYALQNGVDVRTVSSMLGHFDPGFTLRTYTHATRQKQEEAAQKIGGFMSQMM